MTDLEPLDAEERFRFLAGNTPGNVIIGDGGGIALIAGMSRLFPFPKYLLLVRLAITPIPLVFLFRALP